MTSYRKITAVEAESVAVGAFAVVAGDPEHLSRFLEITGLRPETIRQAAASPGFFAAVLDHVASDEQLLLAVASALASKPERIMPARDVLSPAGFE
jgi:hypothetical protein